MNEGHLILAGAIVIQGCYIMYQHSLITRYKRTLNMASYVLEGMLADVLEREDDTREHE